MVVYYRLMLLEINVGKVKLCKFRNWKYVKFLLLVEVMIICELLLYNIVENVKIVLSYYK